MSLLAYEFVQRALLAAFVTGLAAPAVGTYLVQRRQALMGDGIGHVALTGVAVGLLTKTSPTITAVVVAILAAVLIELVRDRGATSGDVALALLFYGGIAGGLLITGLAGQNAAALNSYLFGSITTVDEQDLWVTTVLAIVVVVVAVGLAPRLFAVAHDPDFAKVAGLRVRGYNLLVSVLAAVTVTVAMRTVGLLLVSALMVVPVATARQLTRTFRQTLLAAMALGTASALGGVLVAANVEVPPGATIVLLALAGFALAWPVGMVVRRRRRVAQPFSDVPVPDLLSGPELVDHHTAVPEEHGHRHGPDCGHQAVPHGDHVDYLHGGHRHAPHGSHYDEH
jgi:zinc transport system permease protein